MIRFFESHSILILLSLRADSKYTIIFAFEFKRQFNSKWRTTLS